MLGDDKDEEAQELLALGEEDGAESVEAAVAELRRASPLASRVLDAARATAHALALTAGEWRRRKEVFDECVAIREGQQERLEALLRRLEADPALRKARAIGLGPKLRDGAGLLHAAASANSIAVLRALLGPRGGVSPFDVDLQGQTPLHAAAREGHEEACELLKVGFRVEGASATIAWEPV